MSALTGAKLKQTVALRPLFDRVIIKREEAEKRVGSILLPDNAQRKINRGRVLAVGPGKLLDDGSRGKMDVLEGMTVVFSAYAGHDVELDGAEYLMMTQADILGVIE